MPSGVIDYVQALERTPANADVTFANLGRRCIDHESFCHNEQTPPSLLQDANAACTEVW
jgi:hypothetical protein